MTRGKVDASGNYDFTETAKEPSLPSLQSEYDCYLLGKNDAMDALRLSKPVECSLRSPAKDNPKNVRMWRQGAVHFVKQATALLNGMPVGINEAVRRLTKA